MNEDNLILIPQHILKDIIGTPMQSLINCSCGCDTQTLYGFPYAYNKDAGKIVYAYMCEECWKLIFIEK